MLARHVFPAVAALFLVHCASAVIPSAPTNTSTDGGIPDTSVSSVDAGPTSCRSDQDCPQGLECNGPPGCGVPWQCVHLLCTSSPTTWCDCTGHSFTSPDGCAHRPYAHAGACETTLPATDAGATFPCGSTSCVAGLQYCELTYSDVPTPDSATCLPFPGTCEGTLGCGCITHRPCGLGCSVQNGDTIVLHCPGG